VEGREESDCQLEPWEMGFVDVVWSGLAFRWARIWGRNEVGSVGVSSWVLGGEVRKSEEVLGLGADHPGGNARAELEHLASDVPEESVRRPLPNEHDSKDRDSTQIHGHRSAGTDGVGADVLRREAEGILADTGGGST
jgi:hypothetical protein